MFSLDLHNSRQVVVIIITVIDDLAAFYVNLAYMHVCKVELEISLLRFFLASLSFLVSLSLMDIEVLPPKKLRISADILGCIMMICKTGD